MTSECRAADGDKEGRNEPRIRAQTCGPGASVRRMGDIDAAVRGAQQLEAVLEQRFGAEGRGLHEKLSSVEHQIPLPVVKQIRWIASLRNRVVHEGAAIEDLAGFERAVSASRQRLESITPKYGDLREPKRAPAGRRAAHRKSGSAVPILAVTVLIIIGFFVFSKASSSSLPIAAPAPSASEGAEALVDPSASPDSSATLGPLAAKARRASLDAAQAHRDIDELWQTVQRSTRVTLGDPDVKENADGTSDILVPVTWSLDPKPLLTTLNKYFWDYEHKAIQAGAVDFTNHMGAKAQGIAVKRLWNDAKDPKRPFSDELLHYLTRKRARIRVAAGQYSGTLTFAAGRKCFVSCDDYGHDVFQVHLKNDDPKVLLAASYGDNDQNPVRIAKVPNAALVKLANPVASVEISQAPEAR